MQRKKIKEINDFLNSPSIQISLLQIKDAIDKQEIGFDIKIGLDYVQVKENLIESKLEIEKFELIKNNKP